ncbi:hypothetical protein [Daejeonella sp.]|uniref:hypothetical protein n=1 Tax=Daejeonella sp. TaxID=2805397 RepID=UPI003983ABCA
MKKLTNIVSPFIMLLVPLFLLIGILAMNFDKEMTADKEKASVKLQVPTFKSFVQTVLK